MQNAKCKVQISQIDEDSGESFDLIVLGGGAAGLMCAPGGPARPPRAGARAQPRGRPEDPDLGRRALQLHQPLRRPEHFFSDNPDFCRSALARYTPADFIALVEKHGIAYHEKKLGQLFCDGTARQIVDLLLAECAMPACGSTGCEVTSVIAGARRRSCVDTKRGQLRGAVAGGRHGRPVDPKIGATTFGYASPRSSGTDRRDAAGSGAADLGECEALLRATSAVCGRRDRASRRARLPREVAVHAPRPTARPSCRPRVLAAGRGRWTSTCCPTRTPREFLARARGETAAPRTVLARASAAPLRRPWCA